MSLRKDIFMQETGIIKKISHRNILNSHVEFTNEFIIVLSSNNFGIGSAPKGETISIYEEKTDPNICINKIIEDLNRDLCNIQINQEKLDEYLDKKMLVYGRNNCYAISEAFFNAMNKHNPDPDQNQKTGLCLNFLNGGKHAYTNPVLSDFTEYLLISRKNNLREIIEDHADIQEKIREKLLNKSKVTVNNNAVNRFTNNQECIEFLNSIIDSLDLTNSYDLMIDASAGDLLTEKGYHFSITDGSVKTSLELYEYWMELIKNYNVKFLEDPFHEKDYDSWKLLTSQNKCNIIGDNLYSSDKKKIQEGISMKYTNGIIAKPNQAGTVSAVIGAIQEAQENNQIVITSHRSVSTESIFLSILTYIYNVKYIKIGPLNTDYSSIIRLNELIRLGGM